MSLLEQIDILKKESARRTGSIATTVLLTSLVMLALGLMWNEKYESTATILVEDDKVLDALREEERRPPGMEPDHAELAREVLFDHDVLNDVLEEAGWLTAETTPIERAKLIDLLKTRLELVNVGSNVVEMSFRDTSPQRAFRTVLALTNLFISRTREANAEESRAAYQFLSQEAERYRERLRESEQRLQAFYAEHGDIKPVSGELADASIGELMREMQATALDLEEARVRVRSLEAQLSGESPALAVNTRQDQILGMIAELETQLAALRLQYHDTYPDIVSTKHKIETLRAQLQQVESGEGTAAGEGPVINPLHGEIRAALAQARTEVAALEQRLMRNEAMLEQARNRGVAASDLETQAAELTREYEVTRDLYQDLVQRRESARIAMNMDEKGEGLTMSIQAPPTVPQEPSGLRFVHFAVLGPLLGLGLAFGLVYARVRFDERIRASSTISRELQIPVLATVPMLIDERARNRQRKVRGTVVATCLMLLACYALVAALRMNDFI